MRSGMLSDFSMLRMFSATAAVLISTSAAGTRPRPSARGTSRRLTIEVRAVETRERISACWCGGEEDRMRPIGWGAAGGGGGGESGGDEGADLRLLVRRVERQDATDRLGGVGGVKGGEDQVTGIGRLEGRVQRLQVADLTQQDHVGVLPHDVAERGAEGEGVAPRSEEHTSA